MESIIINKKIKKAYKKYINLKQNERKKEIK